MSELSLWLNLTHDLTVCASTLTSPLAVLATQPAPMVRSNTALTPDLELAAVSVSLTVGGHETVAEAPSASVHVVVALLEKVSLPSAVLPSLEVVNVASAVGHLTEPSPPSSTRMESVEFAEILVLTGVIAAWAGTAAAASTLSIATISSRPRADTFFMNLAFLFRLPIAIDVQMSSVVWLKTPGDPSFLEDQRPKNYRTI